MTAADGAKFAFTTTDGLLGSWSVADGTLLLTVGDLSGNYWIGRGGDGRMSTAANWLNGVPAAGADIDLSFVSSGTTLIADAERTFGAVTMGDGVITFTNAMAATSFSDLSKIAVAVDSTVTIAGDVTITESSQKLCNTIAAGGKLRITGLLEIKHSSGTFTFLSNWGAGAVVAEGGISVNTTEIATMNAKALVLGENGLTFAKNGEFRFKAQGQGDDKEKPVVYALGATTVIGSGASKGKLRGDYAPFTFRTTQFESNLPATITFNSSIDGATNWNAQWAVDGCGRVVCTSTSKADRGVRVKNGATLSLNPGFSITSQTDQNFYVNSGATLEVAASGTVSFYGKSFNLLDGSTLAFNFTERETAPVLALANIAAPTISGAVKVKVSGSVWPKSGEYQLTTCGGFGAEGVTVSLAAGAPKWVTGLTVNGDGNIVLSVKPMGTIFIVR